MICFPNAKINLGLHVVEKRPDGFHNIETIFYPVALTDALEVSPSKEQNAYCFSSSGIPIHIEDSNNIVVKAFELINRHYKIPATAIHLHKCIPFGAGLGGGSADAAFMIKLLSEQYELQISTDRMKELAGELGSDCAFFIDNKAAYATGKGEILSPVSVPLKDYFILLVKPDIHISTPEAYGGILPKPSSKSLTDSIQLPVEEWKENIYNDFENCIFRLYPELKEIKRKFYEMGALYASMSGSGSGMFGIFKEQPEIPVIWNKYFTWTGNL